MISMTGLVYYYNFATNGSKNLTSLAITEENDLPKKYTIYGFVKVKCVDEKDERVNLFFFANCVYINIYFIPLIHTIS